VRGRKARLYPASYDPLECLLAAPTAEQAEQGTRVLNTNRPAYQKGICGHVLVHEDASEAHKIGKNSLWLMEGAY